MKNVACKSCYKESLTKDEVGISKKLLGEGDDDVLCLDCLAAYLDCSVDNLLDKIEEFKDEGCALFQ